MVNRCWPPFTGKWDALMTRSRYTRGRKTSVVGCLSVLLSRTAKMNRREEAREILKAACESRGEYTPGDAIAHMHVMLNEHEDALRELERAYEEHSSSLHFIGIAPEFAPLRSDKRFVSIVKKSVSNRRKFSCDNWNIDLQVSPPSKEKPNFGNLQGSDLDSLYDHIAPVAV